MATKVLLVDDDADDAQFFSDALNELAPDIVLDYCSSGELALEKLARWKAETPDIIFLDLNMPAVNGWECLRSIKSIAGMNQIPIVMYSTANLHHGGVNPSDVGAAAFYQKSNSFGELKSSLASLLSSILP